MLLECDVKVGVDPRQEEWARNMCALELIVEALDEAIDDMTHHHDSIACNSEVGVWTRHKK